MKATICGQTVELVEGNIVEQEVDAIVNAANSRLAGGGGVDGAIHRRGGRSIMEETDRLYPDGCPTGSAVISGAGDLPAKHVLHAVGPVWSGGTRGEPELLARPIGAAWNWRSSTSATASLFRRSAPGSTVIRSCWPRASYCGPSASSSKNTAGPS